MAIAFSIAELVGAVLGYGMLKFFTPEEIFSIPEHGTCVTVLHPGVSITKGFLFEFFLTSALIAMICGVWDPRNRKNGDSSPLRIGKKFSQTQSQVESWLNFRSWNCRAQHRWRTLHRRQYESREILRTRFVELELDESLGVLGRTDVGGSARFLVLQIHFLAKGSVRGSARASAVVTSAENRDLIVS